MEGGLRLDMENRAVDMQEEWVNLAKYNIPEGQFIVTSFVQNLDGTRILLDNEQISVEVFFDGVPILVRNGIENLRMRTWSEVQLKYQDKFIFRNSFLFEVKNSKLVQWSIEESCGFYDERQLRHYCIVTSEEVLDIVATFEPIVKITSLSDVL